MASIGRYIGAAFGAVPKVQEARQKQLESEMERAYKQALMDQMIKDYQLKVQESGRADERLGLDKKRVGMEEREFNTLFPELELRARMAAKDGPKEKEMQLKLMTDQLSAGKLAQGINKAAAMDPLDIKRAQAENSEANLQALADQEVIARKEKLKNMDLTDARIMDIRRGPVGGGGGGSGSKKSPEEKRLEKMLADAQYNYVLAEQTGQPPAVVQANLERVNKIKTIMSNAVPRDTSARDELARGRFNQGQIDRLVARKDRIASDRRNYRAKLADMDPESPLYKDAMAELQALDEELRTIDTELRAANLDAPQARGTGAGPFSLVRPGDSQEDVSNKSRAATIRQRQQMLRERFVGRER